MIEMNMDFKRFIRTPFQVQAVQITEENIEEIAQHIGLDKTVQTRDKGLKSETRYIVLDKRIVPIVSKAYVGWWVTQMDENIRCYAPEIFAAQFVPMPHEENKLETNVTFAFPEDITKDVQVLNADGLPFTAEETVAEYSTTEVRQGFGLLSVADGDEVT